MSATPRLEPLTVTRMLGSAAGRGGSLNLLGLTPDACTEPRIEAALQRQLDRVAQHADGESASADALRVALHEAASGLLNPARRSAEVSRYNEIAAALRPPGEAAAERREVVAGMTPKRQRSGDPLIAKMLVVVGAAVVAMIGLAVVIAIVFVGNPTPTAASSSAVDPQASESPVADPSAGDAASSAPGAAAQPETADTSEASQGATPPASVRMRSRSEFTDATLLIRELRAASELVKSEPDKALDRFARAFAGAADWWCRFDPAQVRAASDSIVEFVYRTSARPEHAARAVSIIGEPGGSLKARDSAMSADEVWPAAWSVGIIARLHRERDLPAALAATIAREFDAVATDSRPRSAGDVGFESGASAAFAIMPVAIFAGKPRAANDDADESARTSAALARWIEGVTLWRSADPDARERMFAEALSWIMTNCVEPEADGRVFQAISNLATEIKWRAGGPARPALVSWFRDSQVSSSDLRVLTAAVATRSGAEGVDATMVLPMTARGEDRERLRARYAEAWGLAEASARADATKRWVQAARDALVSAPKSEDPLEQLFFAAATARVSTAASLLWQGVSMPDDPLFVAPAASSDPDAFSRSLGKDTYYFQIGGPTAGAGTSGGGAATGNAADGAWAARYLAAERNIPVRLERLKELEAGGTPIGPTDAGVLAEAACFASPAAVRLEAQRVVIGFADEPAMVAAMLDILAIAPRSQPLSESLSRVAASTLPRTGDPDWELVTRRALVERLLGMVTSVGVHGEIEARAAAIAGSYLAVTGQKFVAGNADAAADGVLIGAGAYAESLRREAAAAPATRAVRFSLESLDRRREERRSQAIGPIQSFVAEQAGIADLLAFLIATERPASESAAIEVLDELAAARRQGRHVFAQALASERVLLKLWLLRLGESSTP